MEAVVQPGTPASNGAPPVAQAVVEAPQPPAEGAEQASGGDADAINLKKAREILFGGDEEAAEGTETDETTPEAPKNAQEEAKKPSEEDLSPEWAKLTAQQRRHKARVAEQTAELNAKRAEVEAREQAFGEKVKAFEAREQEWSARAEAARRDPLKALAEIGWTLPALTKYVADNGQIPPEKLAQDLKLEYEKSLKEQRDELERVKKEIEEGKANAKKAEEQAQASQYEGKVLNELRTVYHADPSKYPNLAVAPEARTHKRILALQVAAMNGQHPDFPGQQKYLAVSDAMLYAERELAEIYSWQGARQAGTALQAGKPGAEKPSTIEATPISRSETASRVVARRSPDEMSEQELLERAKRQLAGEED